MQLKTKRAISLTTTLVILSALHVWAAVATGPLRVLSTNHRYFGDGSGKAIFLTGSHTWNNFATDEATIDPPPVFDFTKYLDFLASHNHNFFRGWCWELTYSVEGPNGGPYYWSPFPWLRTGPGNATDGKLKFDLTKWNQAYFDRIHSRALEAQNRGMYVSVMLFQGFALQINRTSTDGYPLDGRNNINSIDAGTGYASNTLQYPAVTTKQDEYVKKVIDAVNDLDNILYEISNESGPYATSWQYHMINLIHQYEAGKPKQHPVGMTFQYSGGSLSDLTNSPADWISPGETGGYGYPTDPPAADGSKVIIDDTDHSFGWTSLQSAGIAAQQAWAWKCFLRGMYTLFMDPYLNKVQYRNSPVGTDPLDPKFGVSVDPYWETIRNALGRTRTYAQKMNLATMTPQNTLSSTAYCLANPGNEYLAYQPNSNSAFTVTLGAGTFLTEWYNPTAGTTTAGAEVTGGASRSFTAPFSGDAVLYLKNKNGTGIKKVKAEAEVEGMRMETQPNPFTMQTTFSLSVPRQGSGTIGREASGAELRIYDIKGKLVQVLPSSRFTRNTLRFTLNWDASGMNSGLYVARLTAGEKVLTKQILLLK